MLIPFTSSPAHTLGVEIEMGLVHDETDELECAAPEVLAEAGAGYPGGAHPRIHQELFQSTLELITGVCATPAEAHADLAATVAELQPILRRRHLALIGTGVHPFSSWNRLRLTEDDRYARLVDKIQWPARRMMIHGVHFHVGVPSGDHAIAVTNALTNLLPHFVALSASSPYWFGDDTGLASMRTKVFESMPSASLPPELDRLGGLRAPRRDPGPRRHDRDGQGALVGHPPEPGLGHRRAAHVRRDGHPDRALRAGRPGPGRGRAPVPAHRRR